MYMINVQKYFTDYVFQLHQFSNGDNSPDAYHRCNQQTWNTCSPQKSPQQI
jgi:hypothetical protein